jgi:serine/threonine-protein kinase HipA
MRKALVSMHGRSAGILREEQRGKEYRFEYDAAYHGPPVSLTMPVSTGEFVFDCFPPFFDGLLPEGIQLQGLLHIRKLDEDDLFGQLVAVGADLVGAVTVQEVA